MKKQQIFFTAPKTAELWECEVPEIQPDEVLTQMELPLLAAERNELA